MRSNLCEEEVPKVQLTYLDERDRRAVAAYLEACQAGWRARVCLMHARQIQPDEARLCRILYQAKVSNPVAFTPRPDSDQVTLRAVTHAGYDQSGTRAPGARTARVSDRDVA